ASAKSTGEEQIAGLAAEFLKPDTEYSHGLPGQWSAAVLPAFSVAAHVGAAAQMKVLTRKRCQFGETKPGLDPPQQDGVIPPAGRGGTVRDVEDPLGL